MWTPYLTAGRGKGRICEGRDWEGGTSKKYQGLPERGECPQDWTEARKVKAELRHRGQTGLASVLPHMMNSFVVKDPKALPQAPRGLAALSCWP